MKEIHYDIISDVKNKKGHVQQGQTVRVQPMKSEKKRIVIVDDHPIVRHGLSQIIELESDLETCGEAASANEAIDIISKKKPDLVIVDITLEGDLSGYDLMRAINERYPEMKILVVSMYEDSYYIDLAMKCGAKGYIAKKTAYNNIIEAIRVVLKGSIYLSDMTKNMLIENIYNSHITDNHKPEEALSKRELEIYQMIGNGMNTRGIAERLGINENTVQTYKRNIKKKLAIDNHSDLVRKAILFTQKI